MKVPSSDSLHNRNWNKHLSATSLFRRWPQEVQIGVWEKCNREGKEAIAGLVKVQAALWAVGLNRNRERGWNTHSELSHQGVRTARRANQGIPKGISPEYSSEGLLKLKLSLILWPPDLMSQLIGKDPDAGKDWGQEEKGMTEDEMIGWHHWLNEHEFEQTLRDGEGQGSLMCYSQVHGVAKSWTQLNEQQQRDEGARIFIHQILVIVDGCSQGHWLWHFCPDILNASTSSCNHPRPPRQRPQVLQVGNRTMYMEGMWVGYQQGAT